MSRLPHIHLSFGATINPNTLTVAGVTQPNLLMFCFSNSANWLISAPGRLNMRAVVAELGRHAGAANLFYHSGVVLNRTAINHIGVDILTADTGLGVGPRLLVGGEFGPALQDRKSGTAAFDGGGRRVGNLLSLPCAAYDPEKKTTDLKVDYDNFVRLMAMSLLDSLDDQHPPIPELPE